MRLPALHLLSAFDAVSRHQSVSKAARELHLTTSAVSHRISKLEDTVGTQLLRRTSDGVVLTAEGLKYSQVVTKALANFSELSDFFSKDMERAVIRIHTGPGFARFWLMPRLCLFRDAHPDIDVEFSSSFDPVDFDKDPIDLFIRRGEFSHPNLVVENFFKERFVPLASPQYLQSHPIQSFAAITRAPLIFCTRNRPAWPDWFKAKGLPDPKLHWPLALSHAGYGLEAAAQGLGVLLESLEISQAFLKDERLVPVFPLDHGPDPGLDGPGQQLVYPAHHLEKPSVAIFRDWLYSAKAQNFAHAHRK